ncbi:hypothetical protein [Paraglaciecola sp. 20A4]|uniref:hypothetical protein n=1 Tax=Paraglaciecola sp. 20A4 TaxID=2687288 RepID=UPI001408BA72|nr:hypothetical protein [Paraglaciecola sp. 20A4]
MKNIIHTAFISCLTILILTLSVEANGQQTLEKLYTQTGYPYEPLVKRSKLVRILYRQNGQQISCRTEISQGDSVWEGKGRHAELNDFITTPLRACLGRSEAKRLLKNTY